MQLLVNLNHSQVLRIVVGMTRNERPKVPEVTDGQQVNSFIHEVLAQL